MDKASLVIVLAEDKRQQRLARLYLDRLGYSRHQVRLLPLAAGKGAGEQFVRQHYAPQVQAYRARNVKAETALVVVIDADSKTVADRARELENQLSDAGMLPRKPGERVSNWIPKWSIETWILCLSGSAVDENRSYRHEPGIDESISGAALRLFDWSRPNAHVPVQCCDSLSACFSELQRL